MVLTAVAMAFQLDIRFQTAIADHLPAARRQPDASRSRARRPCRDRLAPLRPPSRFDAAPARTPTPTSRTTARRPSSPATTAGSTAKPLTLAGLRGRVVLIDFWTYTCINCIRTLPHLTAWDKTYRDDGLTIVGVHSPEFSFEKKAANVAAGDRAERHRVPGRAGQRAGDLERLEQPVLAGRVPDRRHAATSAT